MGFKCVTRKKVERKVGMDLVEEPSSQREKNFPPGFAHEIHRTLNSRGGHGF